MRFLMLDRITELIPNKSIKGLKCWTLTDEVFEDHFPGMPIVPGTFLTESMAQLLGLLIEKSFQKTNDETQGKVYPILSMIHKAKFRNYVIPGDCMTMEGKLGTLDTKTANGEVSVFVDGEPKATASFSYFLIPEFKLNNKRLIEKRAEYYNFLTNGIEIPGLRLQ